MPVVTVVDAPADIAGIEVDGTRAIRAVRIERRRPEAAVGTDIEEIRVLPVTGSRKEYPIIRISGLL